MSKSKPANREEFIDYCLRRLGAPVIQINVARDQVEDCVDEALEFFWYNHHDGSVQVYLPVEATEQVLKDRSFPIDDKIIGVQRVLETASAGGSGVFSAEYQILSTVYPYALRGDGMLSYAMAMSYLETLKNVATGKTKGLKFNRHMDRLYIETNFNQVQKGQMYVVEATLRLDPEEFPQVWNDPFLKRYATACIKRTWGNNLRKLQNVQLLGGVQIDGLQILQEANEEIQTLHQLMVTHYQEPVYGFMA